MKFTEEEAFDELKRQLKSIVGDPAVNDREIREQVANLLPHLANEETELAAFATMVLPVLKSSDGGARKFASNSLNKYKRDAAAQAAEAKDKEEPEAGEAERALLERVEKLERELERAASEAAAAGKRGELKAALAKRGVKDEAWTSDLLEAVSVDAGADVEGLADKFAKLYGRSQAKTPASVVPQAAGAGEDRPESFDDVAKIRKDRAAARGEVKTAASS